MNLLAFSVAATSLTATADLAMKYLALGDSYTIGESVVVSERWPQQLVELLRQRGVAIADPEIIAVTGWTTEELMAAIDRQDPPNDYGLVSVLAGVNNQYRGQSVETYAAELRALLDRAVTFAGGNRQRVFVLSIPDWTATPFFASTGRDFESQRNQMARYNVACREVAEAAGLAYYDITPSTLKAATDRSLVAADGLHPSGELYKRWASQIVDRVHETLR